MVAEGIFPKEIGDILHASEANRFAGAGQLFHVFPGKHFLSGTDFQDVGSVVIGVGSLTNPVLYNGYMSFADGFRGVGQINLTFSGTDAGGSNVFITGLINTSAQATAVSFDGFLSNGVNDLNSSVGRFQLTHDTTTTNRVDKSLPAQSRLNPASGLVVTLQFKTNMAISPTGSAALNDTPLTFSRTRV